MSNVCPDPAGFYRMSFSCEPLKRRKQKRLSTSHNPSVIDTPASSACDQTTALPCPSNVTAGITRLQTAQSPHDLRSTHEPVVSPVDSSESCGRKIETAPGLLVRCGTQCIFRHCGTPQPRLQTATDAESALLKECFEGQTASCSNDGKPSLIHTSQSIRPRHK